MAGVLHTSRQRVCGQQRCIIQPPCVTCLPQLGHILALLPQASMERRIDAPMCVKRSGWPFLGVILELDRGL
jgi:hypothetical protein